MDLDAVQVRVLGCLIEKQRTTPDAYPLTLNSLRIACNQSTNRDPVVSYDEATVRDAAQRLGQQGLARLASYHGSRASKYRHLADEALSLAPDELALLCVLMLRGPQTTGELKQRTERLHAFAGLPAVEDALDRLSARELGRWLERRPGQKEARYTHLMEEDRDAVPAQEAQPAAAPATAAAAPATAAAAPHADGSGDDVAALRREVDDLRAELADLREQVSQLTS
jgi:uncharacterized protein YceH (UPF0502 family)